jgi:hypothetical protein
MGDPIRPEKEEKDEEKKEEEPRKGRLANGPG